MSKAKELYPESDFSNCAPILFVFGSIVHISLASPQHKNGIKVIYKKQDQYGLLIFKSLDILKNSCTFDEVDKLIIELESSIQWFNTLNDAKKYKSCLKQSSM